MSDALGDTNPSLPELEFAKTTIVRWSKIMILVVAACFITESYAIANDLRDQFFPAGTLVLGLVLYLAYTNQSRIAAGLILLGSGYDCLGYLASQFGITFFGFDGGEDYPVFWHWPSSSFPPPHFSRLTCC